MPKASLYATFLLDRFFFGIEILKVQEVIRHRPLTCVPLAPPVVRGLINLRGQIVTVIDLRHHLELPPGTDGHPPMNIVVKTEHGTVGLLVDEIGDVLEVGEEDFEPVPETLKGTARELLLGAYKLKGRLLLILDVEKTVSLGSLSRKRESNAVKSTPNI